MRLSAIIVGLGLAVTALAAPQPVDTALEPSTKKAPLSLRCTVYRFMCIGKPAPPEDAAKVESGAANVPENCIVCESTISRVCGDMPTPLCKFKVCMKNKDKCSGCDSVCPNAEPAVDPKEVEHDVAESALEDRDDQSATCDECQDLISKSCKKSPQSKCGLQACRATPQCQKCHVCRQVAFPIDEQEDENSVKARNANNDGCRGCVQFVKGYCTDNPGPFCVKDACAQQPFCNSCPACRTKEASRSADEECFNCMGYIRDYCKAHPGKNCIKNACNAKPGCKPCRYCQIGSPLSQDNALEQTSKVARSDIELPEIVDARGKCNPCVYQMRQWCIDHPGKSCMGEACVQFWEECRECYICHIPSAVSEDKALDQASQVKRSENGLSKTADAEAECWTCMGYIRDYCRDHPGKNCIKKACNAKPGCKQCRYCQIGNPSAQLPELFSSEAQGPLSAVALKEAEDRPICKECSKRFYFGCEKANWSHNCKIDMCSHMPKCMGCFMCQIDAPISKRDELPAAANSCNDCTQAIILHCNQNPSCDENIVCAALPQCKNCPCVGRPRDPEPPKDCKVCKSAVDRICGQAKCAPENICGQLNVCKGCEDQAYCRARSDSAESQNAPETSIQKRGEEEEMATLEQKPNCPWCLAFVSYCMDSPNDYQNCLVRKCRYKYKACRGCPACEGHWDFKNPSKHHDQGE